MLDFEIYRETGLDENIKNSTNKTEVTVLVCTKYAIQYCIKWCKSAFLKISINSVTLLERLYEKIEINYIIHWETILLRVWNHWALLTGSSASTVTTLLPLMTYGNKAKIDFTQFANIEEKLNKNCKHVKEKLTTMPISFFSSPLTSTVLSITRFINWSNPRSVPTTVRLAFSLTAKTQC